MARRRETPTASRDTHPHGMDTGIIPTYHHLDVDGLNMNVMYVDEPLHPYIHQKMIYLAETDHHRDKTMTTATLPVPVKEERGDKKERGDEPIQILDDQDVSRPILRGHLMEGEGLDPAPAKAPITRNETTMLNQGPTMDRCPGRNTGITFSG